MPHLSIALTSTSWFSKFTTCKLQVRKRKYFTVIDMSRKEGKSWPQFSIATHSKLLISCLHRWSISDHPDDRIGSNSIWNWQFLISSENVQDLNFRWNGIFGSAILCSPPWVGNPQSCISWFKFFSKLVWFLVWSFDVRWVQAEKKQMISNAE